MEIKLLIKVFLAAAIIVWAIWLVFTLIPAPWWATLIILMLIGVLIK